MPPKREYTEAQKRFLQGTTPRDPRKPKQPERATGYSGVLSMDIDRAVNARVTRKGRRR